MTRKVLQRWLTSLVFVFMPFAGTSFVVGQDASSAKSAEPRDVNIFPGLLRDESTQSLFQQVFVPKERRSDFLPADEIAFAIPIERFEKMLARYRDFFSDKTIRLPRQAKLEVTFDAEKGQLSGTSEWSISAGTGDWARLFPLNIETKLPVQVTPKGSGKDLSIYQGMTPDGSLLVRLGSSATVLKSEIVLSPIKRETGRMVFEFKVPSVAIGQLRILVPVGWNLRTLLRSQRPENVDRAFDIFFGGQTNFFVELLADDRLRQGKEILTWQSEEVFSFDESRTDYQADLRLEAIEQPAEKVSLLCDRRLSPEDIRSSVPAKWTREDTAGGRVRWTAFLRRPTLGAIRFEFKARLPSAVGNDWPTPALFVENAIPRGERISLLFSKQLRLERLEDGSFQRGQGVLEAGDRYRIEYQSKGQSNESSELEGLTKRDVPDWSSLAQGILQDARSPAGVLGERLLRLGGTEFVQLLEKLSSSPSPRVDDVQSALSILNSVLAKPELLDSATLEGLRKRFPNIAKGSIGTGNETAQDATRQRRLVFEQVFAGKVLPVSMANGRPRLSFRTTSPDIDVSARTMLELRRDRRRLAGTILYRVLEGNFSQPTISIPEGWVVQQVTTQPDLGPNSFRLEPADDGSSLLTILTKSAFKVGDELQVTVWAEPKGEPEPVLRDPVEFPLPEIEAREPLSKKLAQYSLFLDSGLPCSRDRLPKGPSADLAYPWQTKPTGTEEFHFSYFSPLPATSVTLLPEEPKLSASQSVVMVESKDVWTVTMEIDLVVEQAVARSISISTAVPFPADTKWIIENGSEPISAVKVNQPTEGQASIYRLDFPAPIDRPAKLSARFQIAGRNNKLPIPRLIGPDRCLTKVKLTSNDGLLEVKPTEDPTANTLENLDPTPSAMPGKYWSGAWTNPSETASLQVRVTPVSQSDLSPRRWILSQLTTVISGEEFVAHYSLRLEMSESAAVVLRIPESATIIECSLDGEAKSLARSSDICRLVDPVSAGSHQLTLRYRHSLPAGMLWKNFEMIHPVANAEMLGARWKVVQTVPQNLVPSASLSRVIDWTTDHLPRSSVVVSTDDRARAALQSQLLSSAQSLNNSASLLDLVEQLVGQAPGTSEVLLDLPADNRLSQFRLSPTDTLSWEKLEARFRAAGVMLVAADKLLCAIGQQYRGRDTVGREFQIPLREEDDPSLMEFFARRNFLSPREWKEQKRLGRGDDNISGVAVQVTEFVLRDVSTNSAFVSQQQNWVGYLSASLVWGLGLTLIAGAWLVFSVGRVRVVLAGTLFVLALHAVIGIQLEDVLLKPLWVLAGGLSLALFWRTAPRVDSPMSTAAILLVCLIFLPTTAFAQGSRRPSDRRPKVVFPYTMEAGKPTVEQAIVPLGLLRRLEAVTGESRPLFRSVELTGKIEDSSTLRWQANAKVLIQKSGDGPITISLPFAGVKPTMVKLDGKEVPFLPPAAQSNLDLTVDQDGDHNISVEFESTLSQTGPISEVDFGIPFSPSTRISLEIPESQVTLSDDTKAKGFALKSENGRSILSATLGPSARVQIRWQGMQTDESFAPKPKVTSASLIDVVDSAQDLYSVFQFELGESTKSKLTFAVSPRLVVRRVESAGLESWRRLENKSPNQSGVLELNFDPPATGIVRVRMQAILRPESADVVVVPELRPLEVSEESGAFALQAQAGTLALKQNFRNAEEESTQDFAARWQKLEQGKVDRLILAKRFKGRPFEWKVVLGRLSASMTVKQRIEVTPEPTSQAATVTISAKLKPTSAPISFFSALLPRKLEINRVTGPDLFQWFIDDNQLTLMTTQPISEEWAVEIRGRWAGQPDGEPASKQTRFVFVSPDWQQQESCDTVWTVAVPLGYRSVVEQRKNVTFSEVESNRFTVHSDQNLHGFSLSLALLSAEMETRIGQRVIVRGGDAVVHGRIDAFVAGGGISLLEIESTVPTSSFRVVTDGWRLVSSQTRGQTQIYRLESSLPRLGRILLDFTADLVGGTQPTWKVPRWSVKGSEAKEDRLAILDDRSSAEPSIIQTGLEQIDWPKDSTLWPTRSNEIQFPNTSRLTTYLAKKPKWNAEISVVKSTAQRRQLEVRSADVRIFQADRNRWLVTEHFTIRHEAVAEGYLLIPEGVELLQITLDGEKVETIAGPKQRLNFSGPMRFRDVVLRFATRTPLFQLPHWEEATKYPTLVKILSERPIQFLEGNPLTAAEYFDQNFAFQIQRVEDHLRDWQARNVPWTHAQVNNSLTAIEEENREFWLIPKSGETLEKRKSAVRELFERYSASPLYRRALEDGNGSVQEPLEGVADRFAQYAWLPEPVSSLAWKELPTAKQSTMPPGSWMEAITVIFASLLFWVGFPEWSRGSVGIGILVAWSWLFARFATVPILGWIGLVCAALLAIRLVADWFRQDIRVSEVTN